MDLTDMTSEERLLWMRKRHAHFTGIVKDYTSFSEFIEDWDEKLALWGIELRNQGEYLTLYMQLDFSEYESYHVIMGNNGHLAVSSCVWFEEYCANTLMNIFTEEYVDEDNM